MNEYVEMRNLTSFVKLPEPIENRDNTVTHVIVSTVDDDQLHETMVFPATEDGDIINFGQIERFSNWQEADHDGSLEKINGEVIGTSPPTGHLLDPDMLSFVKIVDSVNNLF